MKFSLLMSVYKNEKPSHFNQAMQSIWRNQTLRPNEIILVRDGPLTADLSKTLERWQVKLGKTLSIIPLAQNVGLGTALNKGLRHCSYELVARMDTDDIAICDRFEKQISFLERNEHISVVGGAIQEFSDHPNNRGKIRRVPTDESELTKFAKLRSPLNHPASMFRKSHIEQVGSYLPMDYFEDYYLWIRLLKKGFKISNLEKVVLKFRRNGMIKRRSGWDYAKKELSFFKKIYQIDYINFVELLKALSLRIPLRLLPKKMLSMIYNIVLRI